FSRPSRTSPWALTTTCFSARSFAPSSKGRTPRRAALRPSLPRTALARLVASFERSDRALTRLAAREGLTRRALHVPRVLPRARALEARVRAAARWFVEKG
ncbi:MAG: hypothetical protein ACXWFS_02160, partial [Thermoanaerobaculia bacterium]